MLKEIEQLPEGLVDCPPQQMKALLKQPTLLHLSGRHEKPLFVSVMQHGNEPTGLYAVQRLLKKYQHQELPRALSIFFGNVDAAVEGMRHLPGQPDYNRSWPYPGSGLETGEHKMMQQIVDIMAARKVFASIDVHNNTGLNPHYGCTNDLDHRYLHLATLFSKTVVYFIRPQGVQSLAFADICPAVTVECGKPDQSYGVDHAFEFLETALHLSEFPEQPVHQQDLNVFHTVVTVYVKGEWSIGFGRENADVNFREDLDHLNFSELPVGTVIGEVANDKTEWPITVIDEQGVEKTDTYFEIVEGRIKTRVPVMPSMFTLDKTVIHQDCLGYLMERLSVHR